MSIGCRIEVYDDGEDFFEVAGYHPQSGAGPSELKAGTEVMIDVEGETLVMKKVRELPDWRTMRGMARGGESLTKAFEEERAAENDARPVFSWPRVSR